ncbi:MAG: hypothetical protein ACYTGX_04095 [Planctomycetota bacterium]|jgi:hypothetical protein
MHETLIIDTYAWLALAIYLGVVAAVSLLRVVKDAGGRGRGYGALKGAMSAAGKGPEDLAWAPLADGRFLVYAAGGKAAVVGGDSHRPDVLQPVTRVALVKDMDQQTGLVLTVQGEDLCVTGLDHMARVWAVLQRDETRVRIVFREDEGATVQAALNALAPNERNLVGQWLAEEEIITDVIVGVDYQGTVNAGAEKSQATLIVTNFRVGLLAQTKTTVHQGNQIQTTTHFNLITYLLPVARAAGGTCCRRCAGAAAHAGSRRHAPAGGVVRAQRARDRIARLRRPLGLGDVQERLRAGGLVGRPGPRGGAHHHGGRRAGARVVVLPLQRAHHRGGGADPRACARGVAVDRPGRARPRRRGRRCRAGLSRPRLSFEDSACRPPCSSPSASRTTS